MSDSVVRTLPSDISYDALRQVLQDVQQRKTVLEAIIHRFETRYAGSLEALELRLDAGEGSEHPVWEDSIEWRNAVERLYRTQIMERLLRWLTPSTTP